jgi:hypothetical protein
LRRSSAIIVGTNVAKEGDMRTNGVNHPALVIA